MEILFKRDTAFRKQFFVPDSFAHPAKMDAQLLIWLVEHYSHPGETILDPMAGSGTLMLACGLERNVVLVELEEKFCKMMTGYDCDGKIKGYREVVVREEQKAGWIIDVADGYFYSKPFNNEELARKFIEDGLAEIMGENPKDYPIEIRYQEYRPEERKKQAITECGRDVEHKPHRVTGNWEKVRQRPQLGFSMGECVILQGDARDLSGILADKIITSPPFA